MNDHGDWMFFAGGVENLYMETCYVCHGDDDSGVMPGVLVSY
jgi:cytochrome c